MDSSDTPDANPEDATQALAIEIPILPEATRKEPIPNEAPTIIRDFAYSDANPLFWSPYNGDETDKDSDTDETSLYDTFDDTSEGSGFKGPPPWMQASGHDDLIEEDHSGLLPDDELHGRAVALFDFAPEHETEFALQEGQIIYISSRHGQGWLVAVDINSGECGLVPEEFIRLLNEDDEGFFDPDNDNQETQSRHDTSHSAADEWVDEPETEADEPEALSQPAASKAPEELTDEERQKILDAAEREMAMTEARLRDS